MLVRSLISLVLVILAGYGMFEAAPLLRGPVLTLTSAPYAYADDGFYAIEGSASHAESVTLNGGPLLIDEEGRFSRLMLLPSGGAILTVTAEDRFGRTVTKRLSVAVP